MAAERWMTLAGTLRGAIDAHRMLKGDTTDGADAMLYEIAEQARKEAYGE